MLLAVLSVRIKALLLIELRSAGCQTKTGTFTLLFVSLLLAPRYFRVGSEQGFGQYCNTSQMNTERNKSAPTALWHYQHLGWMARPQLSCTTHWQAPATQKGSAQYSLLSSTNSALSEASVTQSQVLPNWDTSL